MHRPVLDWWDDQDDHPSGYLYLIDQAAELITRLIEWQTDVLRMEARFREKQEEETE